MCVMNSCVEIFFVIAGCGVHAGKKKQYSLGGVFNISQYGVCLFFEFFVNVVCESLDDISCYTNQSKLEEIWRATHERTRWSGLEIKHGLVFI